MNTIKNDVIKIENAEKIRDLANTVVRMAKCSHPMLDSTYENFVNEGIEAPYFSQLALKNAEYDSYIKSANEYAEGEISSADYYSGYKNTRSTLSRLDHSPNGTRLYVAMRKLMFDNIKVSPEENKKAYKEALKKGKEMMQKRIAVLAGLAEGSKELVPCSCNKGIKKFTYRFLRILNR
jgi:hypothetical protein